jgi:hypothetical protein
LLNSATFLAYLPRKYGTKIDGSQDIHDKQEDETDTIRSIEHLRSRSSRRHPNKNSPDPTRSKAKQKFSYTPMIAEKIHTDSVRSCEYQERIHVFGLKIDELPDTCSIYDFLQINVTGEEVKNG